MPVDSKAEKTTDIITHTIVTAINGDILVLQIKIQYWVHNSPLLSWETWIHASPTHYFKIHFQIILPLRLMSSESSLSLKGPLQNPLCISLLYFTNIFNVPDIKLPYILESNPHPFYSFRGLKNQMLIRIACGLDSRLRAGFWKNDRAAVRAVITIQ